METALLSAKLVAMFGLWLASFCVGLLPQVLACRGRRGVWERHRALAVSLLLCFGGGVLLFTTFVHLQPEVRAGFAELQRSRVLPPAQHGLPLAELVFCAGFFFVYLVEELVHLSLDDGAHHVGSCGSDGDSNDEDAVLHRTMSLRRCSRRDGRSGGNEGKGAAVPAEDAVPATPAPATVDSGSSVSTQGLIPHTDSSQSAIAEKQGSLLDAETRMSGGAFPYKTPGAASQGPGGVVVAAAPGRNTTCSLRSLLAVVALSFHAVFEGLAVGLEQSVSNVWYLLVAVATHKLVITFCVGVELLSARTRLSLVLVYMGVFSAVTPVGVGFGLLLGGNGEAATSAGVVPVVLQAMAAGTLLYVVFFEVLQRERASDKSGLLQLVAIVTGFLLMMALNYASKSSNYRHVSGYR